jgi:hypothetical protein
MDENEEVTGTEPVEEVEVGETTGTEPVEEEV